MPAPQHKENSANLDLLRAIAVVSVFFAHFSAARGDASFSSLGRFGVIIFFVHTSFVLMGSLQRLEMTSASDISLSFAFWIRRAFRIYPLAMLFIFLVPVFHIPPDPGQIYSWIGLKGFLSNLALSQNLTYSDDILAPLWSLPLEVQMYAILPFAYFAIRGKRRYRSLALWVLSVLLALTVPRIIPRFYVFRYAPCFTSGIVAFDLIRSRTWKWKLGTWIWPVGIFTAIALFGPHDNVSLPNKMYRAWGLSLLLGILYANVAEARHNRMQAIFHWIAEHSYGIYLSHIVVFWIVFDQMTQLPQWTRILSLVIGSVGVPALLYVSVEKPLILVGGHVARRLIKQSSTSQRQQPI